MIFDQAELRRRKSEIIQSGALEGFVKIGIEVKEKST